MVPVTDTTVPPAKHVCCLDLKFNKVYGGSGTIIAPRVLLTAGHNLYDGALGWASYIDAAPGRYKSSLPFGHQLSVDLIPLKPWVDHDAANNPFDSPYDYAAAIFPQPFFKPADCMDVVVLSEEGLVGCPIAVLGYPSSGFVPYVGHGRILQKTESRIFYDVLPEKGQSGSPVLFFDPTKARWVQMGIHTGLTTRQIDGVLRQVGTAIRVNTTVFAKIKQWLLIPQPPA